MHEIERKWMLEVSEELLGFLKDVRKEEIEQYYLTITDEKEDRYRKKGTAYIHEQKTGSGLKRTETLITDDLNAALFERRKAERVGSIIQKTRFTVPMDGLELELDFYREPPAEKAILEIEFGSEEEATSFQFDSELLKVFKGLQEVTDDDRYNNKYIALNGFPDA